MNTAPAPDRSRWLLAAIVVLLLGGVAWFALGRELDEPETEAPEISQPADAPAPIGTAGSESPIVGEPSRGATSGSAPGKIRLRGLILDRHQRPVAGATVQLDGRGDTDYRVTTGSDGRFLLDDPAPGGYPVLVFGPEILTAHDYLRLEEGAGAVDWSLQVDSGLILTGEVRTVQGVYVEGAKVTPWRLGPTYQQLDPHRAVRTDSTGRFELRGRRDGPTQVLVECEGYHPRKTEITPMGPNVIGVRAEAR